MKRTTFLLTMIVITAFLAGALSFNMGPIINDNKNSTTQDNLECEWDASSDTTQANVTWYKDSVHFRNTTGASSPETISSANTSKGQTWNCTVTIGNSTDTLTDSDIIQILNADPLPIKVYNETGADIGNNTNLDEDSTRSYDANSSDPDGDEVSYSTVDLPAGASFNTDTGVMTWTPNVTQVGNHTVTFIALDNNTPERGSTAKDVRFEVFPVNDAPQFDPELQDQTATEDQSFTYSISTTDEENDTPINFSIASPLNDLIINATNSTAADITFSDGSPDFEDRGNHTVNVTINDSRGAARTDSFNLEVIPVNQLPNLTQIADQTGTQGGSFSLIVNATDKDVNDTLTFSITSVNCAVSNPWSITKLQEVTQNNQSYANATINESSLTNDHVICDEVNISVSDGKERDSQIATFNITNVNDAPTVHDNSTDSRNTDEQNMTKQTAFTEAIYRYQVNATDPDTLTPEGENLTYSDNTTLFNINSSTGFIEFTPTPSDINNYSILITVSDDDGSSDTNTMKLEVKNNSAPVIDDPGNISCSEDQLCTKFITATDADGDNITFTSNDTAIFNLSQHNTTSALINRTYNQSFVGNYSINVTATDIRGATDTVVFRFSVNNTNDAPTLDSVSFPEPIVETHPVRVDLTGDDEDQKLFGGEEKLNFSRTFLTGSPIFTINNSFDNSTNTTTGIIDFTPAKGEDGFYEVNITVTDPQGATDSQTVNFTVLNDTSPPNITRIRPYGKPVNDTTVFAFRNTSDFPASNTTVNVSENSSLFFNHTTTDDFTAEENLTYDWFVDGTSNSTSRSFNYSFDFFSSGTRNITLVVSDDRLENSSWTWLVDVENVNRPPELHNDLENVTIESTETFNDYLYLRDNLKFLDPDDDLDGDQRINGSETNSLSFTHTACSVANITIEEQDVKFTPEEVGTCLMTFTATDPEGASKESNTIEVNVTDVPNGTTTTETRVVTTSSGGGGGGSSSVVIPQEVEVEQPQPLNLIAPEEVTIYRNRSITIPVLLENTWNETIEDVNLGAYSNYTGVSWEFSQNHFDELASGQSERVQMTVSGYRLGENFEIVVNGSVGSPEFTDNALILFNSIEQTLRGEEVRVMVTFARDLLTKNEECQELGELLNEAENARSSGDMERARGLLDTVINGCRYLMSETQVREEQPTRFDLSWIESFNFFYIGAGVLLLAFIAAIVVIETKIRKGEEAQS